MRDSLEGSSLIAGVRSARGEVRFAAFDPRTGEMGQEHIETTEAEIGQAVAAAVVASEELSEWSPARIAGMLRACADALEDAGDELVSLADRETALGRSPRLEGELVRTTGQWRAFARLVESGWHLEPIIDHADDSHPDLRRVLQPLGPVAIFGASNFPLAFSVPGGDTASALAAGCPVVIKGHPSHPATSALAAAILVDALQSVGAPVGTLSLVQGAGPEVGKALVLAEGVEAVAFTGSLRGGRSIYDLASSRVRPIPVYAEMGSLNPVFVTSAALAERGPEIARGFAASMTLGVGQFCTKPGLVFLPDEGSAAFLETVDEELSSMPASPMLSPGVLEAFRSQVEMSASRPDVDVLLAPKEEDGGPLLCSPGILLTTLDAYLADPQLSEEHFGPLAVVVTTPVDRMVDAARSIPGTLTATIHAAASEAGALIDLQAELRRRTGRIVWNGFPTGVAVVPSMQHGGPYPATTNPLHTSVGMTAVRRFLRPVAFQDVPDEALPPALQESNPLGLRRLVDWAWD